MWKVLYIAPNEAQAKKIKELLTSDGFLVKINDAGGKRQKAYEICVPLSEAEDAYEVLCENKFQA